VVRFVEAAKRAGYDMLKLHGEDGVQFDSAVAAAHRVGLPIVGHPPGSGALDFTQIAIDQAIQAGYRSLEHLGGVKDAVQLPAIAAALKQAGVWVCPTLFHMKNIRGGVRLDAPWPEFRYVDDKALNSSLADANEPRPVEAKHLAVYAAYAKGVKLLHEAGVGLLLGTDASGGVGYPMAGFGVHRELQALVAAGLTPYEALLTGTRNAAAYLGTLDSSGTVAVGKRADLVLLAENPLADIRHAAQPAGVMWSGRWLARADLDRMLTLLEGTIR
jgi:imidazolonepropionase-like amidohydrolase